MCLTDTNDECNRRPETRSHGRCPEGVAPWWSSSFLPRFDGSSFVDVSAFDLTGDRLASLEFSRECGALTRVIFFIDLHRYSAIDMSTFEALKLAYIRSTGRDEPGMLAVLAFGGISGSVGATSVYPLNLVRTRLQASGSSGHPQRYAGPWDVVTRTYQRDGWRGFYRGLFPTLAKV